MIFETAESDPSLLRVKIETGIRNAYGFEVPVVVRSKAELEEAILRNPFTEKAAPEQEKLYVTFLTEEPTADAVRLFETYRDEADEFRVLNREVYILCRQSYGKTKLSNAFVEKKLKVPATTRNWDTVNTLAGMAGAGHSSNQ